MKTKSRLVYYVQGETVAISYTTATTLVTVSCSYRINGGEKVGLWLEKMVSPITRVYYIDAGTD